MTSRRTFLTYSHCKCSAIKLQDCPDTANTKCQKEKKNKLDKNDEMMLSSIQITVSFVWKTYINHEFQRVILIDRTLIARLKV